MLEKVQQLISKDLMLHSDTVHDPWPQPLEALIASEAKSESGGQSLHRCKYPLNPIQSPCIPI